MKKLLQALLALALPSLFFYFAATSLMKDPVNTAPAPETAQQPEQLAQSEGGDGVGPRAESDPRRAEATPRAEGGDGVGPRERQQQQGGDGVGPRHSEALGAAPSEVHSEVVNEGEKTIHRYSMSGSQTHTVAKRSRAETLYGNARTNARASKVAVRKAKAERRAEARRAKKARAHELALRRADLRRAKLAKTAERRRQLRERARARAEARARTKAELQQYVAERKERKVHADSGAAPKMELAHEKLSQEDPNALVLNQITMELSEDSDEAERKMSKNEENRSEDSFEQAIYQ